MLEPELEFAFYLVIYLVIYLVAGTAVPGKHPLIRPIGLAEVNP